MSIKDTVNADMKEAMKAQDKDRLSALRMLWSEIRKGEIDSRKDYEDDDIIKIIKTGIKKREESVSLYIQGGREELAAKEKAEIEVLQKYLPKQLSIAEIEKIVEGVIAQQGLSSPKDIGVVMRIVMAQYGAQLDGKTVQEVARIKLQP
ncbi:GatB/YqeY domain-containing protein [bacterium]|nr:GatB/YqeY domain-containing protein [bacterium]MCP5463222.1 GatB/YqeY domain-containing protein [bacterium]